MLLAVPPLNTTEIPPPLPRPLVGDRNKNCSLLAVLFAKVELVIVQDDWEVTSLASITKPPPPTCKAACLPGKPLCTN